MLMNFLTKLFICLALCSIVGCTEKTTRTVAPALDKLYQANPKQDAAKAIANGDFQFIAVHNHALLEPMGMPECLVDKYGYRTISNEEIKYMSYDFQLYGAMSQIYANWYNYEIYGHLEAIEEFPC